MSFIVKVTGSTTGKIVFSLEGNPPSGATINSNTGMFSWTPTSSQGAKSYTFDLVAKKDSMTDRESLTITVNDTIKTEPKDDMKEPEPSEPKVDANTIAPFVDSTKDPQYYIDRYNNELIYKKWFDENYPEYTSIYHAVGLDDKKPKKVYGYCGTGTKLIDGVCTIIEIPPQKPWWQFW